jgi:manganese transport protein
LLLARRQLLQGKGFRWLEAIILGLVSTIALCFLIEIVFARPDWAAVAQGYVPNRSIIALGLNAFIDQRSVC